MSNDYRYVYLREKVKNGMPGHRGFPVACVAMSIDRNSNTVAYGVTTVHPTDKKGFYVSNDGRALAVGRLIIEGKSFSYPKRQYHNINDITNLLMGHLLLDKTLPTRTRKALKLWLKTHGKYESSALPTLRDNFDYAREEYEEDMIYLE